MWSGSARFFHADGDAAAPFVVAKLDGHVGRAVAGILDHVLEQLVDGDRDPIDEVGIAHERPAERRHELAGLGQQAGVRPKDDRHDGVAPGPHPARPVMSSLGDDLTHDY